MKVLFLTIHDQYNPGSQVRVYQFLPHLEKMGIKCRVEPFIPTKKLGEKKFPWLCRVFLSLVKRFRIILLADKYDAVVVQADVLPFGLQSLLRWTNSNIIFEFDDPIWEMPPQHQRRSAIIKTYYRYQIRLFHKILKKSKVILTENAYSANYAKKFNQKVAIIPTPIDTVRFKPILPRNNGRVVLGWVGNRITTHLLEDLAEVLEKIGLRYGSNIELHNIGGTPIKLNKIKVKNIRWQNDKILDDLAEFDIGLMPLNNHPFDRGRLGTKMIIYMSLGIPFVAQDIGLNKTVVQNGVNGYLASTKDEWVEKLSKLIDDKELRTRLGENGRKIAVEQYDIKDAAKKYAELLKQIISY